MEIEDKGLPLHKDATVKIRPRIFLEGNFFVDLQPARPARPRSPDGGTIPVTQTSTPVQLDQMLTALQSDSREDLQHVLEEYGKALNSKPTAEQDAELPPEAQGPDRRRGDKPLLRQRRPGARGDRGRQQRAARSSSRATRRARSRGSRDWRRRWTAARASCRT